MPNSQMGKEHFQPPDTHMQMLFIGTACLQGWHFTGNRMILFQQQSATDGGCIYRFWDPYSVTHLHALLLSTDQKYFNHVILGPSTHQARGWSASLDKVKSKILEDFGKARNLPWGLQQQTSKCSHKIILNETARLDPLSVLKMVFFQVSISQY